MERPAGVRFQAGSQALAVVVSKAAQDCPRNAGCVHAVADTIKLLAKIRIHAADHVFLNGHAEPLGGDDVLPGELAMPIVLYGRPLIDGPEILGNLIEHEGACRFRRSGARIRRAWSVVSLDCCNAVLVCIGIDAGTRLARDPWLRSGCGVVRSNPPAWIGRDILMNSARHQESQREGKNPRGGVCDRAQTPARMQHVRTPRSLPPQA